MDELVCDARVTYGFCAIGDVRWFKKRALTSGVSRRRVRMVNISFRTPPASTPSSPRNATFRGRLSMRLLGTLTMPAGLMAHYSHSRSDELGAY